MQLKLLISIFIMFMIYLTNLTILYFGQTESGIHPSFKNWLLLTTHKELLPWFFKMVSAVSVLKFFFHLIIVVIAFAMMSLCLTDFRFWEKNTLQFKGKYDVFWGPSVMFADGVFGGLVLLTNICLILYAYINGRCQPVLNFWCVTHITPTVISGILLAKHMPPFLVVPSRTLGILLSTATMESHMVGVTSVIAMSVIIILVLLSASFILYLSEKEPPYNQYQVWWNRGIHII